MVRKLLNWPSVKPHKQRKSEMAQVPTPAPVVPDPKDKIVVEATSSVVLIGTQISAPIPDPCVALPDSDEHMSATSEAAVAASIALRKLEPAPGV